MNSVIIKNRRRNIILQYRSDVKLAAGDMIKLFQEEFFGHYLAIINKRGTNGSITRKEHCILITISVLL